MRIRFIAILLAVCSVNIGRASKYAGDFQELGVGARALGMAAAVVAQPADPFALYYNPAATALADRRSVGFMHAENFGGVVKNDYLSLVIPGSNGAVGAAYYYLGVPDIKLTRLADTLYELSETNRPVPYDTVSASDHVLFLNYSRGRGRISYGANIKLYYRSLAVIKGFGGGLDAGLQGHFDYLDLGLTIRDVILSPVIWDNGYREQILPRFALGLAPRFEIPAWKSILRFEWDLVKRLDNGRRFEQNLGMELAYNSGLFVRFGLQEFRPTLGLGIGWRGLTLDYAFVYHPELSSSNKVSAGVSF